MDLIRIQLPNEYLDFSMNNWDNRVVLYKKYQMEFTVDTSKYYEQLGRIIEVLSDQCSILIYKNIDRYDPNFDVAVAMRSLYHKTEPDELFTEHSLISIRQQSYHTIICVRDDKTFNAHSRHGYNKVYEDELSYYKNGLFSRILNTER